MKQNKQFEEWVENDYEIGQDITFWDLPFSMQWGVYLEFFDSVHIVIHQTAFDRFEFITVDVAFNFYSKSTNRTKAQIEGIEKAFKVLEG